MPVAPSSKLLGDLIALPSVNPAFLPPGHPRAGEHRVAEFLEHDASRRGLEVQHQRALDSRSNLIVRLRPPGEVKHRVLLAPHMDTINASDEAFVPRVQSGRLHGRGACDTKGSIAAMFTALCALADSGKRPLNTEIMFVGLIDEEHAQAGSRAFAAGPLKATLGIVGEPTGAKIVTSHKGSVWLSVRTQGKAAHGSQPHHGRNAVCEMAKLVTALQERYAPQLSARNHPLLGSPTWSIGTICGGTQANIVPDACEIMVDRRTLPGETESSTIAEVENFIAQNALSGFVSSAKVSECLPLETSPDLPWVRSLMRAANQPEPLGAHYFCDASVLAQGGTPSVVFGPGDIAQAHTNDEWIDLENLERAEAILTAFLRDLP